MARSQRMLYACSPTRPPCASTARRLHAFAFVPTPQGVLTLAHSLPGAASTRRHVCHRDIRCDAVTVYDKSDGGLHHQPCDHAIHRVPNVGRESEAYLRFIIAHYDGLADYTLLMQDDTHVHVPSHRVAAFVSDVRATMLEKHQGKVLQVVHRGRRLYPPRLIDRTEPLYPRIQAACARFGILCPPEYTTHVCAFVLVSRAAIRRHSRELYQRLHAWHAEAESVRKRRGATDEQLAPWLLELMWQLIWFEEEHHSDKLSARSSQALPTTDARP